MKKDYDFKELYKSVYGEWSYGKGIEIDPKKLALIVIDAQPAFSSNIGMMKAYRKYLNTDLEYFFNRVKDIAIPNILKLLDYFRKNNMKIYFVVTWSETEDLSDLGAPLRRTVKCWEKELGEQVYRKWNKGMKVYNELSPRKSEMIVSKRSGSAFMSSSLDYYLRNAGIEQLVHTGFNTNGCVSRAVIGASNLGYENILAADATACFSQEFQEEAEVRIGHLHGMTNTTDEIIKLLEELKT